MDDDVPIKQKLLDLAEELGATVQNVFEIKLGDKTRKANAAVIGLGKTRKIILGDTLVNNYSDDERIIKHSISFSVPGYILNPKHPGIPNLLRTYTSAPIIDFGYNEANTNVVINNQNESKRPNHTIKKLIEQEPL